LGLGYLEGTRHRRGGTGHGVPGLLGGHRNQPGSREGQHIAAEGCRAVHHVAHRQIGGGGRGRQRHGKPVAVGQIGQALVKGEELVVLGDVDREGVGRGLIVSVPGLHRPERDGADGLDVVQQSGAIRQHPGKIGHAAGPQGKGYRQTGTGRGGHLHVAQLVQRERAGQRLERHRLGPLGDRVCVGHAAGVRTVGGHHHRVGARHRWHIGGGGIPGVLIGHGVGGPGRLGGQGNTRNRRWDRERSGRAGQGQHLFTAERNVVEPQDGNLPGGVLPLAARRGVIQEEMHQRIHRIDVHQGGVEGEVRLAVDITHDFAAGGHGHDHMVILVRGEGGRTTALDRIDGQMAGGVDVKSRVGDAVHHVDHPSPAGGRVETDHHLHRVAVGGNQPTHVQGQASLLGVIPVALEPIDGLQGAAHHLIGVITGAEGVGRNEIRGAGNRRGKAVVEGILSHLDRERAEGRNGVGVAAHRSPGDGRGNGVHRQAAGDEIEGIFVGNQATDRRRDRVGARQGGGGGRTVVTRSTRH